MVTKKDGVSRVSPGDLNKDIQEQIVRIYGKELGRSAPAMMHAVEIFYEALANGYYSWDDEAVLLSIVNPLEDALAMCKPRVIKDLLKAKEDRDDYINDYNFLQFLESI